VCRGLRHALIAACSLAVLVCASDGAEPVVKTLNAVIASRDGERLRVMFAAEGQPAVLFKPADSAWDWSRTRKLVIPVENPGGEPVMLLLSVGDDADRSMSGKVSIAPGIAGDLTLWINAPSPRKMGIIAGPSLTAGGLEQHTLPVTATEGSVDTSRVTSVRLGIVRPTAPRQMVIGPPRVTPPSEDDSTTYRGIVDSFGQFHPGSWPEKVSSIEMLRARGVAEAQELARWLAQAPEGDRFGGLMSGPAFRATGFFRTEQRESRWWLVTPEGHGFFSIGIDAVAPSGATYVEGREFMFRDLPARDGELAAHWSEADDRRGLGAQRGRSFDHGHAFDFYTANLERKFGAEWRRRWREETVDRLTAWGFNTIGNWSDPDLCAMHRLPYTVPLSPEGEYAKVSSGEDWWGPMPDPFNPRFVEAADKMSRNAAARFAGDPYLIGYFVDNELSWGRSTRAYPQQYYALAVNALAAGRESPANSAFIGYLTETYHSAERLGQAWGISLSSWNDLGTVGFALPRGAFDNPAVTGDLAAFNRRFADAYYRIVAEALHRHDPDHLYLGSRFAWQSAEAVEACARWCDVVSFNRCRRSIADDPAEWAKFHALGKPALIGEFHFGSADRGLFWEGLLGSAERANAARPMRATSAGSPTIPTLSAPTGFSTSTSR
jgi:Beta-galactosidase